MTGSHFEKSIKWSGYESSIDLVSCPFLVAYWPLETKLQRNLSRLIPKKLFSENRTTWHWDISAWLVWYKFLKINIQLEIHSPISTRKMRTSRTKNKFLIFFLSFDQMIQGEVHVQVKANGAWGSWAAAAGSDQISVGCFKSTFRLPLVPWDTFLKA